MGACSSTLTGCDWASLGPRGVLAWNTRPRAPWHKSRIVNAHNFIPAVKGGEFRSRGLSPWGDAQP